MRQRKIILLLCGINATQGNKIAGIASGEYSRGRLRRTMPAICHIKNALKQINKAVNISSPINNARLIR